MLTCLDHVDPIHDSILKGELAIRAAMVEIRAPKTLRYGSNAMPLAKYIGRAFIPDVKTLYGSM